ncbi:Cytochrome b5-related protein [Papilio machaon]|uniref:Cytochrome b5-related protein n=1 Tax=Papilio machaon TaxID=76193 RepID=A0A194RM86_PAPMA|nr:cytochrome b5-related protein [Papilio machaon]KPJ18938.1 Cytochrome b5-related protein [Papilio machaon]
MPPNSEYLAIAAKRAEEKKTHVSFPQLVYPSLRDDGLRDPVQWLMGKAMDDGAEGVWRVHDGLYDFEPFLQIHPGGAEWLELTKGTDITEAFESHHLNPAVNKVLEKYYIRKAKTPRNSPFTFKDDGFFRSLKRAVWAELQKTPRHIHKRADTIIDGLFVAFLVSCAISCISKSYWVVMTSYLSASLCLAWLTVAAHNYIHKKTNWRMYLFNFSLWSYRDFRVSHALSHHLYPNTLMDLEISGFEPFVFWLPLKNRFYGKFAIFIELATFGLIFPVNFFKRLILNFLRKDFFLNHYRWHDVLGFLTPVWMWVISGCSFYDAFIMWLWIICTASFIFFNIGSNAAHHHPICFRDGDEVDEVTRDWGLHEVEAVMDRRDINTSFFRVMTFFGHHTLHHLFPTLDHAVLEYMYPVFLQHCEKYRAKFRVTTQFDMVVQQIKLTAKKTPNLLEKSN